MKDELDHLMQINGMDALWVTGPGDHNPAMVYLTGGAHLTQAELIKLRNQPVLLFHHDMERDEARRTGLATRNLSDCPLQEFYQQANGDPLKFALSRYRWIFAQAGLTQGRVAVYGRVEIGPAWAVLSGLQEAFPALQFVSELNDGLLSQARATKDMQEVERMRRMGQITTRVVAQTADYLTSHQVRDGKLVKGDGRPLTIGEVKRQINLWLASEDVENPEGTIFAVGYDSAVPHSVGNPDDVISLGKTIIFDIFPCEAGGGYFYDFTRTWCLGYAPDEAYAFYEDVRHTYQTVLNELKPGALTRHYMHRACDLFEERGYPTMRSHPSTQKGFVHGLGHSLGLNIHERPQFSLFATDQERLLPGMVMTVEPGLYDPERQIGVRLEDTVWMRPDGQVEVLAPYPLDLILPVRQ